MKTESIVKRIKYIYMLCLFAGIGSIVNYLYASMRLQHFLGIPYFSILIIAEGVIFYSAFKTDSIEKAHNLMNILKIGSLIIAASSVYNLVTYYIQTWGNYFDMFEIWCQTVIELSAFFASLAVFFSSVTLIKGNIKKFNIISGLILVLEIALVFCISVAALIVSEALAAVLIGIVFFIFMSSVVPRLLKNKIVKGSIIGGIIAGDAGAVVGAVVAANKEKK